jgi:hypothetical protein
MTVIKTATALPEELFLPGEFTDLQDERQLGQLNQLLRGMVDRIVTNSFTIGTVDTGDITADAVSAQNMDETAAAATIEAETSVASVTLNTDGGFVLVIGAFVALGSGGAGNATVTGRIRKNDIAGAILRTGEISISEAAPNNQGMVTLITRDTTPAATQTYVMSAEDSTGAAAPVVQATNRVLFVLNVKR